MHRSKWAKIIEGVAWAMAVAILAWATVLERQAYSCEYPTKNVVKWGIPLLAALFLSLGSVVLHILVCGCNCIGCIVEKTIGPARLVFGATVPLVCIFVARYAALPKCADIEQEDRHALIAAASINIVLFGAAFVAHRNPPSDHLLLDEY